jgi:iron complex outermembrane receptor protein
MPPWRGPAAAASIVLAAALAAPVHGAVLEGEVREAGGTTAVSWADVRIEALRLGAHSDEAGRFRLADVPAGRHLLAVQRQGYKPLAIEVEVTGDTAHVTVALVRDPLALPGVTVDDTSPGDPFADERVVSLGGRTLRENMSRTLADVLADEPGIGERTMGPAPARPVLRGLGGDRVLILQDGRGTGDLSATASDHAVVLEPVTSREVAVVRGPATLIHGPSTLGGVIDVRRDLFATTRPPGFCGTLSLQGESVNRGGVAGLGLTAPWREWVLRADGSWRDAGDIDTPQGTLPNTSLETHEVSAGLSRVTARGFAGVAASDYRSAYGIPGGFLGAHPEGVDIDLERQQVSAGLERSRAAGFDRLEVIGNFTRYYHREIESSGVIGVSYGLLTYDLAARGHWVRLGPLGRGLVGVSGRYRDYASGFLSFTPATLERGLAAFAFQTWPAGAWNLEASLRVDGLDVNPAGRDTNKTGIIRDRTFAGVSGGLALSRAFGPRFSATGTAMRAFRPPGLEDLFAEGPHLAAYAYEIGDADLEPEDGVGLDLTLRWNSDALRGSLSGFYNVYDHYLYASNTGQLEVGPGTGGLLARYQYAADPARLAGGEVQLSLHLGGPMSLEGTASAVRGTLTETGTPLPAMPPFNGRLALRWQTYTFGAFVAGRGAAAQDRLGEFETPTAAYLVADAGLEWQRAVGGQLHSFVLSVDNLLDTEYRQHLSITKQLMPEPGRNVSLLARTQW